MRCKYKAVLFDLDGTLSESAPGIRRCIELSMLRLGKPVPDLSDFSKYIGPPLTDTFRRLCGLGDSEVPEALRLYLDYYDTEGMGKNRLYDGIGELLHDLRDCGALLAVCSSKNQLSVEKVCDYLDITRLFDALCGSASDGTRKHKEEVIPYTQQVLGVAAEESVMIGDTHFDAQGARLSGTPFIGVTYGYGTRQSMTEQGAHMLADSPGELRKLLLTE